MAECPQCGSSNPPYAVYCGKCGYELPAELRRQAAQGPAGGDVRLPGPPLDFSGPVRRASPTVRSQGEKLEVPRVAAAPIPLILGTKESRRIGFNTTPIIGGTCAIAAGFLGMIQGIVLIAGGPSPIDFSTSSYGFQVLLGLVGLAFGFLSILGGMDARIRTKYKQSLTRAILGMVAFGFVIGALLGLVAVILIALSQDEFDGRGE